jgi:hypothetical protein
VNSRSIPPSTISSSTYLINRHEYYNWRWKIITETQLAWLRAISTLFMDFKTHHLTPGTTLTKVVNTFLINDLVKRRFLKYFTRNKKTSVNDIVKSLFSAIWSWKRLKSLVPKREQIILLNIFSHACLRSFSCHLCAWAWKNFQDFLTRFLYRCYFFSQRKRRRVLRQLFVERKGEKFPLMVLLHFGQLRDVFCTF